MLREIIEQNEEMKVKRCEDIKLDRKIRHKKLGIMTPRQFVDALELEVGWIMDPYTYTIKKALRIERI